MLENIRNINELKNTHANEDFLVVGGGRSSSINTDVNFNKYTIVGCNYRPIHIPFDYHMLHDPLSVMWNKKNNVCVRTSSLIFSQMVLHPNMQGGQSQSLNPMNHRDSWVGDIPVLEYLHSILHQWSGCVKRKKLYQIHTKCPETDFCLEEYCISKNPWHNSGFLCADLAAHMGAKSISFLGVDFDSKHSYFHPVSDRMVKIKKRDFRHYIPLKDHLIKSFSNIKLLFL